MRVIAGKARGSKLIGPDGLETRPTSDRIKESLFSIINFELPDTCFLDLFSGSGGIGIEALSRGAKEATFVDSSKTACRALKVNLEKTALQGQSQVIHKPVQEALKQLASSNKQFDIIFMDPPYNKEIINHILCDLVTYHLLAPDGFLIIERPTSYELEDYPELTLWKERTYNKTTISFLKGV